MGLPIVLAVYGVGLTILAAVAATVHAAIILFVLKRNTAGRKRAIIASAVFPFLCVAYAGCWFVGYAVINDTIFHRDPGLGDSWYTPLPNGYAISMIDVTDIGTVYDPKSQSASSISSNHYDAEFGVRQLQLSKQLILGAADSKAMDHFGREDTTTVDTWFVLDTTNHTKTEYKSRAELERFAEAQGLKLNLQPIDSIFEKHRYTWFDSVAGAVLLLPPALAYVILIVWIWKLRQAHRSRNAESSPEASDPQNKPPFWA